jgi:hypothetical protein
LRYVFVLWQPKLENIWRKSTISFEETPHIPRTAMCKDTRNVLLYNVLKVLMVVVW